MEWLEKLLGDVEGKEEIIEKVKQEFPKHAIPKDQYNKKITELESKTGELEVAQEKLKTLNGKVESLGSEVGDKEKLKEELANIKEDYDKYKETEAARLETYKKQSATKDLLYKAKADPSLTKLLLKDIDYENVKLTDDGAIGNPDEVLNPLKQNYKTAFAEETVTGTKVDKGDNSDTSTYKAKYKKAMENGNRREAIKIKQEAFKEGEII